MLADTKIPAHEQYAGILAVYNILGELHASWKKLLTKAYVIFITVVYNFKQPLHQTELRPARL